MTFPLLLYTLGRMPTSGQMFGRFAALLLLAFLSSACAATDVFSDLPLTLSTEGLERPVPGGGGRQVVVAASFSDSRKIGYRCGMKKDGFAQDSADAFCQGDPSSWIALLLANELRASGFTVLEEGSHHRNSAVRIDGSLLKIFVESVWVFGPWSTGVEADLSVKLEATSGTALAAERTFFVKGWEGGAMFATPKGYQAALRRATHALLEEMVQAVVELMDRYPQLGSLPASTLVLAQQTEESHR